MSLDPPSFIGRSVQAPFALRVAEGFPSEDTLQGLTETTSTFTRREVLQQLADRLPAGAPVTYLEEAADAVIAHDPASWLPSARHRAG